MFIVKDSLSKSYEVRVTLRQVIRGDAAWQKLKAANSYNDPPKEGYEYILALVRFEYLKGPTEDTKYDVSTVEYTAVSASGSEYDNFLFVVEPAPRFQGSVYPGGSVEGWMALQVAVSDAQPVLTFGRKYDGTGGIWWKLGW